jgi:hypothetical protein
MFWNVKKMAAPDLIASACSTHPVDLLVLAECNLGSAQVRDALNRGRVEPFFEEVLPAHPWVRMFSRLPSGTIHRLFDGMRYSISRLKQTFGPVLLLVAAHLPSKLHNKPQDQYSDARELRDRVVEWEGLSGHSNTIIIGDFNMNPFDTGMTAADGLHAMMSKAIAANLSRQYKGRRWEYFYNPMWSRIGDESHGPPGTYFYHGSDLECLFWHTFDQVLLRPSLLKFYKPESLKVLSKIGETELADQRRIHTSVGDHLPILISLSLEGAS